MKIPKYVILLLIITITIMSGCTGTKTTSIPTEIPTIVPSETPIATTNSTLTTKVEIKDFSFNPTTVTIKKGTTIMWINEDSAQHTATSNTGVFDLGQIKQGQTFSYVFTKTGSFDYGCLNHPNMKGTIIVTD